MTAKAPSKVARADTDMPSAAVANPLVQLVTRAADGDKRAWDALVERFGPLIWSICRKYRLSYADAEDVGQNVWLQLTGHLGKIRDPAALPGWLATVTRRECLRVTAATKLPLAAERYAALREAFAALPLPGQRLIALLLQDPPVSYAEISARLDIPVGSIGPTRRRYLDKLRCYPAVAALVTSR